MSNEQGKTFPLFVPIKFYKRSLILLLSVSIYNFWVLISPPSWLRYFFSKRNRKQENWIVEIWILILIGLLIISLTVLSLPAYLRYIIVFYILLDTIGSTIRDIVISPIIYNDNKGPFLSIDNPSRWLIVSFINIFVVILAFAILFLEHGLQFAPTITDATTAIYMSTVTFTTLGYGDIKPICSVGKRLVLLELSYFLFFLLIKIPLAVSVIRTESRDKPSNKD